MTWQLRMKNQKPLTFLALFKGVLAVFSLKTVNFGKLKTWLMRKLEVSPKS